MKIADYIDTISRRIEHLYDKNEAQSIARTYICDMLNLNNTQLIIAKNDEVNPEKLTSFATDLERLSNGEPVQYVVGKAWFYDLQFAVNKNVLIPRQETEILVNEICKYRISENPKILDIGCGSGCISVSLQKNLPNAKIFAVDVSENALDITKQNAELNNVEIRTAKYDILSSDDFPFDTKFDIIVSNPPYVRNCEKALMHKNVTDFEPHLALYVDDDQPLIFYEKIFEFIRRHQSGHETKIFFEINEYLGNEMISLCEKFNCCNIDIIKDLSLKNRFVEAMIK